MRPGLNNVSYKPAELFGCYWYYKYKQEPSQQQTREEQIMRRLWLSFWARAYLHPKPGLSIVKMSSSSHMQTMSEADLVDLYMEL